MKRDTACELTEKSPFAGVTEESSVPSQPGAEAAGC